MNTALPIISHFTALAASNGLRVGINWPTWLPHVEVEHVACWLREQLAVWRDMHTAVAQDRNRAQLERDHYRRRAQTRINWPCWFTKHGHAWHTHRECQPLAQSEPQVADMMCRFCAQAMCWCQKFLHCVNFFPEILRTSWRWHSTNQDVYIALY